MTHRPVPWSVNFEPEVKTEYAGTKLGAYYTDPEVLLMTERISARTLYEAYGWGCPEIESVDVCHLFYTCASVLGAQILFPEDTSPQLKGRVINDLGDIKKLRVPEDIEAAGYIPHLIKRYECLQRESALTGVAPELRLPAQSPLGTAVVLRGTELFTDIILHPKEVKALLEIITETAIRILRFEEVFTGQSLESVGMDDDYGGLFSPETYEEFNFPFMKRIYDAFDTQSRSLHSESLSKGHLRFVRELRITDYDAWPWRDLTVEDVKGELPATFFTWNIETTKDILTDRPSQIKKKYRNAVAAGAPGMALDLCARGVPLENIRAFIEVAREFE
jgi:uroporphyrinogen-III decarboxylase